jgi:hypothetical protein
MIARQAVGPRRHTPPPGASTPQRRRRVGRGGLAVLHELQQAMPYGLLVRDVADITADGEAAPPEQT